MLDQVDARQYMAILAAHYNSGLARIPRNSIVRAYIMRRLLDFLNSAAIRRLIDFLIRSTFTIE